MPTTKKDKLFHLTGCTHKKVVVERKTGVAMKSLCALTTTQYRLQRKILSKAGITFARESSERKEQQHIVQDNIVAKDRHLLFPDEPSTTGQTLKETPIVYAKDLCSFVTDLLDKYNEQQLLDFHDVNIPDDQIWVKIGGDHGGDSLKLCLQIANVKSPNSRDNTFAISFMFNGKDTAENFRKALWHYRHQVYKLKKLKWMGKGINFFLFGDYDIECKVFGLCGASGTYSCLWCFTTKRQMQKTTTINTRHSTNKTRMNTLRPRSGELLMQKLNSHLVRT